jgi:hypothetical protein
VTQPPSSSAAPAEDLRSDAELKAALANKTSELSAVSHAFRLAARTAAVGVPFAVVYGVVSGWLGHTVVQWAIGLPSRPAETTDLYKLLALGAMAFGILYAAIQFPKRERVTRASWAPALFAVPAALVVATVWVQSGGATGQLALVAVSFTSLAMGIVWYSFGGAAANIAWMRAAQNELEGKPTQLGEVLAEVRSRTVEISAVHGAKVTAITVGMQFLLPGIFYALQFAFADAIAVLDPSKRALRRSGQLSSGIRGRLFRLLLVWTLVVFVVAQLIVVPLEGARTQAEAFEKFFTLFFDPSQLSLTAFITQEVVWGLSAWVQSLAFLSIYRDREDQVRARAELKRRAKAAQAAATAE